MKSSSNDVLKNYFRILYHPTEAVEHITSKPVDLAVTFLIVIASSVLLIAGVLMVGDVLYSTFQYQVFSYPLEWLTSGQIFGYYMPYSYYALTFLTDIIFALKAWLFLSVLLLIFLRLFKHKISIKQSSQVIAWSLFPFAIVMFVTSVLCLLFKQIFPLIYHYIYFGVLAAVFLGIVPIMVILFLQRIQNVPIFDSMRAYYLTIFTVYVIWTLGHADKFMLFVW